MRAVCFDDLLRVLDLRNQDQVRRLGNDLVEIFQTERQLVDAHHAFALQKVDRAQRIAHQEAGSVFLAGMHRIFQVEDDRVGTVQRGVDEVLGLAARKVEPRAPQAITRRRLREARLCQAARACLAPVRRAVTAASMRAAITKGRAPSS